MWLAEALSITRHGLVRARRAICTDMLQQETGHLGRVKAVKASFNVLILV